MQCSEDIVDSVASIANLYALYVWAGEREGASERSKELARATHKKTQQAEKRADGRTT